MSAKASIAALLAAPLALALTLSCARTSLEPDCPAGMTLQGTQCVCLTDEGCPHGYICQKTDADADAGQAAGGVCVCQDTACCPAGYAFSSESGTCVCADSACCPQDHRWDESAGRCACDNQSCCPDGYTFDPSAGGCRCAADQCCPTGFVYDPDPAKQTCVCNADSCCPLDHKFDAVTKTCVCARDSCCPLGYTYNTAISACVCSGNFCCPVGFRYDVGTNRCVCTTDASCGTNGVHNRCDQTTGTCRCRDDLGCSPPAGGAPQYCNGLGFCQSLACTSDRDCPVSTTNPTFCDITTGTCIPVASCTLDDHCPYGQICSSHRCVNGCRRDDGCPLRQSCISGQCQTWCRDSQMCPQPNQFCTASTGTCATVPGRADCVDCSTFDGANTCQNNNGTCLVFIGEGQNNRQFCGVTCQSDADCPAGYDCDGVIFGCFGEGSTCQSDNGQTITCKTFNVENEGISLFCADATGKPHAYFHSCAPNSGFCPASVSP